METIINALLEVIACLIGFPIMFIVWSFLICLAIALIERFFWTIRHNSRKRKRASRH